MKHETMKILFVIKKSSLLKNGEAPIVVRVTINGVSDEVRIQRSVLPRLWNQVEKPRDFDPFGQAGFAHLCLQYD